MRSEAANPDVPKHFVLVHDGRSTTTAEDVAATFDDAKTNLGDDAVSLLPVNSGPGAHPVPDVWSAHAEIRVVTGDGSEAGGSEAGGSEAGGSEAGGSERSSDVAERARLCPTRTSWRTVGSWNGSPSRRSSPRWRRVSARSTPTSPPREKV